MPLNAPSPTTINGTKLTCNSERPGEWVVEVKLSDERAQRERDKFNWRVNLVTKEGLFPFVPTAFFRESGQETVIDPYSPYGYQQAGRQGLLAELSDENHGYPLTILAQKAILGSHHWLLVDPWATQFNFSREMFAIGNELAARGKVVWGNGAGAAASMVTAHFNVADMPEYPCFKPLPEKAFTEVVSVQEAPGTYKERLRQGHLVSIAFLGNDKVGFMAHVKPYREISIVDRKRVPGTEFFQDVIEFNSLSIDERQLLLLVLLLGPGGIEMTTSGLVLMRDSRLTSHQHTSVFQALRAKSYKNTYLDDQLIRKLHLPNQDYRLPVLDPWLAN
ncbi:MAG: hypothetical protein ACOCXT_05755 [Candidatus Dojkabacteria bacterium]